MDCASSVFLFLLFVGLLAGMLILARRIGKVEGRFRNLEEENAFLLQRVDRLSRQVRDLRPEAPEEGDASAAAPAPIPTPVVPSEPRGEALGVVPPSPAPRRVTESPPVAIPPVAIPPVEPPGAAPPEPPAPPPWKKIDWEQWIGVRGAAVVGAAVLGLAGLLFLKYSIEHGLIPPIVRVIAGVLAGLGCLVGSELLRRRQRDYSATADGLAGAGVVILYAAVWAARVLYGLIGSGVAFVLMILITVACGALAWRYASRVVAVLGLVGGFATPALLSSGSDRPLSLFGYLLLLNVGVLFLSIRRGWSVLGLLSLTFTTLYQLGWIFGRMDGERALLGLFILGLFAVVYAVVYALSNRSALSSGAQPLRGSARLTQAAAVLLPMLGTFYFAGNADLGDHLAPLAALLLLLSLLAQWIAIQQGTPLFGTAAAAAGVAAVALWCLRTDFRPALEWEVVACGVGLALAFHLPWEIWGGARGIERSGAVSPPRKTGGERVATLGYLTLFVLTPLFVSGSGPSAGPWILAWSLLGAMLWRQGRGLAEAGGAWLPSMASILVGFGAACYALAHHRGEAAPMLLYALVAGVGCQIVALRLGGSDSVVGAVATGPRWERAAAALPLTLLVVLLAEALDPRLPPWAYFGVTLGAAALAVLAATRGRRGWVYLLTLAVTTLGHTLWSFDLGSRDGDAATVAFGAQALAVVGFTLWPFLAGRAFRDRRWAWYGAALAGPLSFFALRHLFEILWTDAFIGALPVALGAISLAAATRSRQLWREDEAAEAAADDRGRSRLVWFAAVALGFLSLAIPLQLDKEWVTLGWALQGAAVLALWKRLDHPGLKYFGLALLAAITLRLVANPAVLGYYPRGGWPVLNWLLYTYLVPAAALVFSARLLAGIEVQRQRRWEAPLYARGWTVAAAACGVAAIAVVFVWINLAIFDYFSPGRSLLVTLDRLPARDLALSLAWAVYALLLLALGMARGVRSLRWLSLGFLMLTLVKVALYDLGELKDLYRVASLVGLAISLLLVSLAYQRFVFGRRSSKEEEEEG